MFSRILRTVLFGKWRETELSEMSVRKVRLTLPSLELPMSRGRAVSRGCVRERFLRDQLTNVSNNPRQSCPRKIL